MYGEKGNKFIVIENGQLTPYALDDRSVWEIGRPSKENVPDIKLHSTTVSRKHGRLQNMDGVWFYLDYNGKNGTVYNRKHITSGLNGRVKPIMLEDGDVLVFGGGEQAVVNCKTIWAFYFTKDFGDGWSVVDSRGYAQIQFAAGENTTTLYQPDKGTVIEKDSGIGIYMGDLTYLMGDMRMMGR